jgi:O-antigen/teichoic acid export membrane protein
MLRRELAFRRLALIDMLRGAIVPCASLVLALMVSAIWALVAAAVLGSAIGTAATLTYRHVGFARPVLKELREETRLTRDLLVSRVAFVLYSESDFMVAGRRLGSAALGSYSLAWTLANNPIQKVSQLLSDVVPAVFGAAQQDRSALRRYYLNITELLAFVTLPLSLGMCVVSQDFVSVALGARWSAAATPLALLAGYAGFRSLFALSGHLFPVIPRNCGLECGSQSVWLRRFRSPS